MLIKLTSAVKVPVMAETSMMDNPFLAASVLSGTIILDPG
jgi:hypothetical protein